MLHKEGESLETYLERKVFAQNTGVTVAAKEEDARGFAAFMERYKQALAVERAAVDHLR